MERAVKHLFETTAQKGTGLLGAGFLDLSTGEQVYLNGDTVFPTASVYKIFVLCELFRRQKEGSLSLSDRHTLLEGEKSIGSGVLELIGEGAVFSLMDYVMLMMAISDNTASEYLLKLADPENIRKNIFQPLGLTQTWCSLNNGLTRVYGVDKETYRRMMDEDQRFHCRNAPYFLCREEDINRTSPKDMVKLLSLLYQGQLIDPETDQTILNVMAKCQTNARIPAKLPHGIKVAHKTGSIDHLANDCGIVYTPYGDYVLTLFYNGNLASEEEYEGTEWTSVGNQILSELSGDLFALYKKRSEEKRG